HQAPPSVRALRPELPPELEGVVTAMMATNPDDRCSSPKAVMQALVPFLPRERHRAALDLHFPEPDPCQASDNGPAGMRVHRILIVDDEPAVRAMCRCILDEAGLACDEAENGKKALVALNKQRYDLALLDIDMPEMTGI